MAEVKTIEFTGFNAQRLMIYAVLTIFLVLLWNVFSTLLIIATAFYAAYKFGRLALGGFRCVHCYFKFGIALAMFIFSLGAVNEGSILIPLVFLWVDALTRGKSH